ncbi:MAG: magnesium transporter CorA family protein [Patescibacteria group bacterium]|nr:magnesium transporter CorA family protein [Patescibacteria group bacterium]
MSNYQKISSKIEKVIINNPATPNEIVWVNIVDAGKSEIEYLRKEYGFDMQHLKASTAKVFSQRPMLMDEEDYLFMILHFPVFNGGHIMTGEIEFFIGHGYLITIHNNNVTGLSELFNLAKKSPKDLVCYNQDSSAILLAELLDKMLKACYLIIDENSKSIDQAEEIIFNYEQKQAVALILNLRHNIISIRRIMQNHKNILQKLMLLKSSVVPPNEIKEHYLELVEHSKRIWEMLENQKEMVEVLNNTNESLLNDKMTSIMKTLTIFSVIVYPLTLVAGIFGMNAKVMPLVDNPYGFWMILILMFCLSTLMLLYFFKKRWLP